MRRQIGKQITNEDLLDGCRGLFEQGFDRVKLYFMCGLPGERDDDLDGIVEMAETISRLGKEVRGRFAKVTVSVSNFVPKPHTPYQWQAMQTREYFDRAHQYLRTRRRSRSDRSEVSRRREQPAGGRRQPRRPPRGRGDRAGLAPRGTVRRLERAPPDATFGGRRWPRPASTSTPRCTSRERPSEPLPWEHVGIRQGRDYLVGQWDASRACLAETRGGP